MIWPWCGRVEHMPDIPLTPIQQRILQLLSDGRSHARAELHACLDDELAMLTSLKFHVSRLRQKLRPTGRTVHCEIQHGTSYYSLIPFSEPAGNGVAER